MITIHYDNTTLEVTPKDDSFRYRAIMGTNTLTLKFTSHEFIELPLGAYVDYEGQRYTLEKPENFTKSGTRLFEYTLTLEGSGAETVKYKLRDQVEKRLKFNFTSHMNTFS